MARQLLSGLLLSGALTGILAFMPPPVTWRPGGTSGNSYITGIEAGGYNSGHAAIIRSNGPAVAGFGTYEQSISPAPYLGRRVRLTGYLKTKDVTDWAGLWMRVDREEGREADTVIVTAPSFDNMENRPVTGTTDWTRYEVVLDVPDDAALLSFGALLSQTGQIWFDGLRLEVVPPSVLPTSLLQQHSDMHFRVGREAFEQGKKRMEPLNLDFEES